MQPNPYVQRSDHCWSSNPCRLQHLPVTPTVLGVAPDLLLWELASGIWTRLSQRSAVLAACPFFKSVARSEEDQIWTPSKTPAEGTAQTGSETGRKMPTGTRSRILGGLFNLQFCEKPGVKKKNPERPIGARDSRVNLPVPRTGEGGPNRRQRQPWVTPPPVST